MMLICCLFTANLQGQRYKVRHIKKDLEQLEGFENAFLGFVLYDPEKNKVLASQYADKHLTPASNTKLFTFFHTQNILPKELPALGYELKSDSLIFWSTGYPLTLHPEQRDSTIIEFLKRQDGHLFYYPRPIEDPRYGPGWGWDDFGGYYGAEKSAFPIYGNSIQFVIDNERRTYRVSPHYPGLKVSVNQERSNRARVQRDEFWNEFEITFDSSFNKEDPIDTLLCPIRMSDQLFIELLSREIEQPIHLLEAYSLPKQKNYLAGVARDSLYKWMLQPSDNLFAESLLLMASGMDSDTLSTKAFIEKINDDLTQKNQAEELVWVDGSGLSRYNMFTPNQIITVLHQLYLQLDRTILFELFPQGGKTGTLSDWYKSENGIPYVFAKTGTLSNNHSLSGYILTDKGKTLIFSMVANHYTCPTDQVRKNFGLMLEKIREAY